MLDECRTAVLDLCGRRPYVCSMQTIRLAFSPDADDWFMFQPLIRGKVVADGLRFVHESVETEALNARTEAADSPDVCAVSIAHVPTIADRYLLLPHGGSVGRGYGPIVVARAPMGLTDLADRRVAVPGLRTTAHLVLSLLLDRACPGRVYAPVVVPITPYARVFGALAAGEVDAALLIHEGRLSWSDDPSLHAVIEIGEAWASWTGLPLPLGGNVIRRDLGPEVIEAVSRACRASIEWSLAHRDEAIDALLASGVRDEAAGLSRARLDRYLGMYANADSAGYDTETVRAIEVLLGKARAAGLAPGRAVEWAP